MIVNYKPVLFIAWDLKNARALKFVPLRRKYYTTNNAMLLSVPSHLDQVILKASNFWRKTIITLPIHAVKLDDTSIAQLINGFHPLNKTAINTPSVLHIENQASIKAFSIKQRNCSIEHVERFKITILPLSINIQPIHYQ